MVIAVPFIALLPDITIMIVNRVFFRSPADVYMAVYKSKHKARVYKVNDKMTDHSIENEKMPLKYKLDFND